MPAAIEHPFYPIIYVRGFAGTQGEVEQTVATPFMGFNLGSTKIRQLWNKQLYKHIFESPLVRLMKDHGYRDVYEEGQLNQGTIPARSIVIFRYYDEASQAFGTGEKIPITHYAGELHKLILQVRQQVTGGDPALMKAFRVYLVAHSMGGLICRTFLQNPQVGTDESKSIVDKVYTYATPHNGIDVRVIGNVPALWFENWVDTFNRDVMAKKFFLLESSDRVDTLDGKYPPDRFFCLVGTDAADYPAASGWSSRLVGPLSDGLVRIENASVQSAPRAFVHRSHSGDYGIVNSESGYQNLCRFLFGDVRVDGVLRVDNITLPPKVQKALDQGREVRASYHFEVVVRVRGAVWDLHRRTTEEYSAILRTYDELFKQKRHPHLFSTFLSASGWAKTVTQRRSLGFQIELRIGVPEYTIDKKLQRDDHYEGSYIFRDTVTVEVTPPAGDGGEFGVRYGYDSNTPGRATRTAQVKRPAGGPGHGPAVIEIPIEQPRAPGIKATLELRAVPWNRSPR